MENKKHNHPECQDYEDQDNPVGDAARAALKELTALHQIAPHPGILDFPLSRARRVMIYLTRLKGVVKSKYVTYCIALGNRKGRFLAGYKINDKGTNVVFVEDTS